MVIGESRQPRWIHWHSTPLFQSRMLGFPIVFDMGLICALGRLPQPLS